MSVPDPATTDWVPLWSLGGGQGVLPADTVVPAATRIISNKLLQADAQPAHRFFGDGKQEWGPGGAMAVDTNLYRSAADTLKTDDTFYANAILSNTEVYSGQGTANQLILHSNGKIYFGTALDTNLYRSAADTLRTDDTLSLPRVSFPSGGAGGDIVFGGDTNLYRSSANTLMTDDTFVGASVIIAQGYLQGINMVYGNSGVSVYDSAIPAWITMTGYGNGVRSSGHLWTAPGYSMVSGQHTYNRADNASMCCGVSDDAKWYRTTEVPVAGVAWKTDNDVYINKDAGVAGWLPILVFISGIGLRRIYVGAAGSGGAGNRALIVNN